MKRSAAGLCRFHAPAQKRAAYIVRARAEQARLPLRRQLRAAHDRRLRYLRNLNVPRLRTANDLNLALGNFLDVFAAGVIDARVTRVLLRGLRIAAVSLRHSPNAPASADLKDFHQRLITAAGLIRDHARLLRLETLRDAQADLRYS